MRFCYVLCTSVTQRQHDVGDFVGNKGHAGYILYLYQHGHLPDFDVREVWQYYHPPLHHIRCAIWLHVWEFLGVAHDAACESLQMLTLCDSWIALLLMAWLFRYFHLHGRAFLTALALVALHPTFFLLAGSVNNDMLSVLFFLGTLVAGLSWYRKPCLWRMVAAALCMGLGMMTKLSVWMAAVPLAVLFLARFCQMQKGGHRRLVGQAALFLVLCAPLALWWEVRNAVKFGVPIAYVPELSLDSEQYVGNIAPWKRLLDFSWKQFCHVGMQFVWYGGDYFEWNPTIGLWKTAVFDELVTDVFYPQIHVPAIVLFWSSVLLSLAGTAAVLRFLGTPAKAQRWQRLALLLLGMGLFFELSDFLSGVSAHLHAEYPLCRTADSHWCSCTGNALPELGEVCRTIAPNLCAGRAGVDVLVLSACGVGIRHRCLCWRILKGVKYNENDVYWCNPRGHRKLYLSGGCRKADSGGFWHGAGTGHL